MANVIEQLAEYLRGHGCECSVEQDRPVIQSMVTGNSGRWPCIAIADSDNTHLIFMSMFPVNVPPEKRSAVAELFTRLNYSLNHGCYELDLEDGEAHLRTSIPVFSGEVAEGMLHFPVCLNFCIFDKYFGAIMKVLYSDTSPKDALKAPKPRKKRAARLQLN